MKVYQLTARRADGGVTDWNYNPIFATPEGAEKQKEIEFNAYTKVNGVVMFECPYIFEVREFEVKE